MAKMNKHTKRKPSPGNKHQDSVIKEAWANMNEDFNRLLPEKLRHRNKRKFVLWLFLLELLVLGVVGKFLYDWLFQ